MANNDTEPSPLANPNPLVPTKGSGTDLVSANAPYASPSAVSKSPEVVTGGIDPVSLWHSFRRRWLLATCLGALFAALAAVGLYILLPAENTAVARFVVHSKQPTILDPIDNANVEYGIYRETTMANMRRPDVIRSALNLPQILGNNIAFLEREKDKSAFLTENLDIRFLGDSEIMQVRLQLNEDPEDLKLVVRAVGNSFIDTVVTQQKLERTAVLDALRDTQSSLGRDIKKMMDEAANIRNDLNLTEQGGFDAETRLIFSQLLDKMRTLATIRNTAQEVFMEYNMTQLYRNNEVVRKAQAEAMVQQDQRYMMMSQQLDYMGMELSNAEAKANGRVTRAIQRLRDEYQAMQQQVSSYREQLVAQFAQSTANQPDPQAAAETMAFQGRSQLMNSQIVALEKEIEDLKSQLAVKAEKSTDLLVLEAEIAQKNSISQDIVRRIEAWQIEMDAGERIEWINADTTGKNGEVFVTSGITGVQQYIIAGIGALATFGLVCVGIASLEFFSRKLNGPQQVDEGLGIRVVGNLPSMGGRKLNAKHPVVAQLTESIDSLRTALMHEATNKPRQVVLVTSPATKEGRTTVASQLAASLARAGRRTLLIDADIRSPSLHRMFDEPIEDGLCEVLRAEADVADVVRPTQAEGLWLLTAGYCDADAVHAMATDQIQPIFEKLRSDYDFIIIDGAPVLGISDSLMIGQHCDGALLSVLRDHSQVPKIYQSAELLRSVGVRLIGAVVNGVSTKLDRRVTRLRAQTPKAERKQLEQVS